MNEEDVCVGYAFCQLQEQPFATNMVPFKSLFIDDLCVDQQAQVIFQKLVPDFYSLIWSTGAFVRIFF